MIKFLVPFFTLLFSVQGLTQCDSVPTLNQEIVKIANTMMGKKVDRGECWDLAALVLNQTNAKWDKKLTYGRALKKGECFTVGDIVQFENIEMQHQVGNKIMVEKMPHHTAIIYKVINENEVVLIHQNTSYTGKKVGTSSFWFLDVKKGKYTIYRPVN
jgi:hypothetical protein